MSRDRSAPRDPDPAPGAAPSSVGPYRLLSVLGEGGMGTVWLAEQRAPIERRVALKVIKLGMDTKDVLARFDAERQALALMSHPNIAKVHDAGRTEDGKPWFAMEHVPGDPLTVYCDKQRANAFGLYAVIGNVFECCLDGYAGHEESPRAGEAVGTW